MKKKLMISLALIVVVMFGFSMQASACTVSASIVADCVEDVALGYLITYELSATVDTGPMTVNYSLTISTSSGDYTIISSFTSNGLPKTGFHGTRICGPYTIFGEVWIPGVTSATFYTEGVCPCEPPPPPGGGCTPGYWRNHLEDWGLTGLTPGDDFDTTFGVDLFTPDITLGQAIWLGGGASKKLARHGTAALLSALHPDVNYPLTPDEVIAAVQAGDAETLANFNDLGMPGFCD